MTMMRTAFATVGTTSHPRLVRHLSGLPVLQELAAQGFDRLVMQVGGSPVPEQLVPNAASAGIHVEVFSYKESIAQEIRAAELVISHAGAGTAIEVLRCHKPLVVVVNDELMDNHQTELAEALSREEYLLSCYPDDMMQTLRKLPSTRFRSFPGPDQTAFPLFLDRVLFSPHHRPPDATSRE